MDGTWTHKASISNINGPGGLSFHSTDNRGIHFTQKGIVNSFNVHTRVLFIFFFHLVWNGENRYKINKDFIILSGRCLVNEKWIRLSHRSTDNSKHTHKQSHYIHRQQPPQWNIHIDSSWWRHTRVVVAALEERSHALSVYLYLLKHVSQLQKSFVIIGNSFVRFVFFKTRRPYLEWQSFPNLLQRIVYWFIYLFMCDDIASCVGVNRVYK